MKDFLTYLALSLLLSNDLSAVELRKKIVVIDTGVKWSNEIAPYICKDGWIDLTNTTRSDELGHGSNVIYTIAKYINNNDYCIISIKAFVQHSPGDVNVYLKALRMALEARPVALNLSLEGKYPINEERAIIESLLKSGTKVVAAAGNDGTNLDRDCNSFPICYNIIHEKFYTVGSINSHLQRSAFSNYGKAVNSKENGEDVMAGGIELSGTSQAAAIKTGKLCSK